MSIGLHIIVVFEVIFLLLPTSLVYAYGFGLYINYFDNELGGYIYLLVMLCAGYALISLWWLVFSYWRKYRYEIPRIWRIGLYVGTVISICFICEGIISSKSGGGVGIWVFGGPVFLMLHLLSLMKEDNNCSSEINYER
ncbi:hypothetical protein H0A36_02640 [Endozoicomonas sp. SM1973]|uniref:Uncharacterized protein n=1 Tax=Spartinivicinus marinus TaxID=2994442 RepID=A0A853I2C9_9GAMM|nr:hypothetical protein [Spartinivicinus marinus]MCX4029869.1 hypothetical protein [Spartinivicinus marinus]NYZ64888.1 hypothetical protein [Spartinivicinus marinus]